MNPRVQEYITRTENDADRRLEAAARKKDERDRRLRAETLIRLGLCEREESEKTPLGDSDWRWDFEKGVYYRWRALEVTDEEYEAILAAGERLAAARLEEARSLPAQSKNGLINELSADGRAKRPLGGNRVAQVLRVFSWILFILGLNLGIVVGGQSGKLAMGDAGGGFDALKMIWVWIIFLVLGMLFYGISEALVLLKNAQDNKHGDCR